MFRHATAVLLAVASLPAAADASVMLLARGALAGSADSSGLQGNLESGVPANILGGIGSGLAYAGGSRFIAVPDRGPNATTYNNAIDDTTSYISRFHELDLSLTASSGGALPFTLSASLVGTTLLSSPQPLVYGSGAGLGVGSGAPAQNDAGHFYFTGRSDNYGGSSSANPANARFDPEGVRVSNDGASVFVSDEYGPYVRQFDRKTGALIRTFDLPANLAVANQRPVEKGATGEIAVNTSGRTTNKGMEGLAITPDGKTLVGIMQAALIQDKAVNATKNMVRLVTIDIASGATAEYGYMLTKGSGVSEIVAVNNHEFLVDERDGAGLGDGSEAQVKQVFKIDLAGATPITNLNGAAAAAAVVPKAATPFVDLVAALTALGVAKADIPAKIESLSFGQDVAYNGETYHTLYLANDNDFLSDTGGNQFYVFGFTDRDLANYTPQALAGVPEPATWASLTGGFGLLGLTLRRRRARVTA